MNQMAVLIASLSTGDWRTVTMQGSVAALKRASRSTWVRVP
jgi:hypothetical protein